jgi:endoglucanase
MVGWGMNVVRYAMNYKWFESDDNPFAYRERGFRDLEQRLAWARNNGIYVILDMHIAQGGMQEAGEGDALWTDQNIKNRFIGLWREIARRYKDDPAVAGYEILNEPHPPSNEDWKNLANEVAGAIREVDSRHMLVICNTMHEVNTDSWFNEPFTIEDDNVLYTAHIYDPVEFTHQGVYWASYPQGAYYPDRVVPAWANLEYRGGYYWNPGLEVDSGWRYLEGNWGNFLELAPGANLGQVFFQSTNELGTVWIDNIVLERMDRDGRIESVPLRNANFEIPLLKDSLAFEHPFADELSFPSFWELSDISRIRQESGTIVISGSERVRLTARLLNNYFIISQEYPQYRVSGWVRGENLGPIVPPDGNWNAFMIDAWEGETMQWDRAYLAESVGYYANWARENNVPFYIGEFGVIDQLFGRYDHLTWTEDMLGLMNAAGLHWTYWTFRSDANPGHGMELIQGSPNNSEIARKQDAIDLLSRYAQG